MPRNYSQFFQLDFNKLGGGIRFWRELDWAQGLVWDLAQGLVQVAEVEVARVELVVPIVISCRSVGWRHWSDSTRDTERFLCVFLFVY